MAVDPTTAIRSRNLIILLLGFLAKQVQQKEFLSRTDKERRTNVANLSRQSFISKSDFVKIKQGMLKWSDANYQKAFDYLKKFEGARDMTMHDLTDLDIKELVYKIVPDSQHAHAIITEMDMSAVAPKPIPLAPNGGPPAVNPYFKQLKGFYAALFVCRNPLNIEQYAVAVDTFEFRDSELSNQLDVEQMNFRHEEFVPKGRLRLRERTIEIDMIYRHNDIDYPDGKYLAPMPEKHPDGKNYFIATMLDVKIMSRLVVARPVLFLQINEAVFEWSTHPEGSNLFEAVSVFLKDHTQFAQTNFELCPTREARFDDWIPVSKALRAALNPPAG